MVYGKCVCRVLGTIDCKASQSVTQFLFYVSWKTEGFYLPHVLPKMQKAWGRGAGEVSWAGKNFHGSLAKAAPSATDLYPSLRMLTRGISIHHASYLLACSFLWGMVHAYRVVGCSCFISEMCRAETPAFFLEYLKANYVLEPLRPAPSGISFECSYLKTLCNLTQLSEKAWNPKEQCSELGMEVGAGKEVLSPAWGLGHTSLWQCPIHGPKKNAKPLARWPVGTLASSLWTMTHLMRCSRGITKPSIWLAVKNISITTLNNWSSQDGNKSGLGPFWEITPSTDSKINQSLELGVSCQLLMLQMGYMWGV